MLKENKYISASMMCANMLNIEEEIKLLEEANVDYLHIDIMDGEFVNNYGINFDDIRKIRSFSKKPLDYHLMVKWPEKIIKEIDLRENDILAVHIESECNIENLINILKMKKVKFGLAINPETKVELIEEYIYDIDFILIMLVNPGFSGQKKVEGSIDKIYMLNRMLQSYNKKCIKIAIDGNVGYDTIFDTKNECVSGFILGTTCLFNQDIKYKDTINRIKEYFVNMR